MKNGLVSIGRMAGMNRVTVATLRLYDQLGLLTPRYTDPDTGYRYYDIAQNARLDMIAYMKELGMSLGEIGDVLRQEDITLIEIILARKNERLHQQLRELHSQHDAVERAIASIERYRKSPTRGTISLEYIDRRYIWGLPCTGNFYETDIRAYEQELTNLRSALLERGFSHVHSYNIGTTILQKNFVRQRFISDSTFVFVDHRDKEHFPDVKVLDSGMFACIYLDCYDDEIPCAQRLLAHCREQGWHVCGDYICEVLTEFNVFDGDQRSMFLRLQTPVRFQNEPSHPDLA